MSFRWLAVALLVALSSVVFVGRARAQTAYTTDSLTALMVNSDDVNLAVAPGQHVTDVADNNASTDTVVRVVRLFKTDQGIIAVTLFANADGSAPTADERNTLLSGQYLNDLANSVFSGVTNFTATGGTGVGDADVLALFTGNLGGVSWDSVGDAFVKGNVFGAMLYSTPGQADGAILGIVLGTQIFKLP